MGILCGLPPSSSITQSALPAVSAFVASNKNFLGTAPGVVTVNIIAPVLPPPGKGLNTVILFVPAAAISDAGTDAVNCVGLIKFVVSAVPFHLITELLMKSAPVTANVKPAPPATAVAGLIPVNTGTALFPTAFTVKAEGLEMPPPGAGLTTSTVTIPAAATRLALIVTETCVVLINVVVSGVPFHATTELLIKLDPINVSVKPGEPAVMLAGVIDVTAGVGLPEIAEMVKTTLLEMPPPGEGLETFTFTEAGEATIVSLTAAVSVVAFT